MSRKNESKVNTERQKLENEVSFLRNLINKHKVGTARDGYPRKTSVVTNTQFSWSKEYPKHLSSQHNKTSLVDRRPSAPSTSSHQPTRQSLAWKKPVGSNRPSDQKFKYVANNRQYTNDGITESGVVTLEPVQSSVSCKNRIVLPTQRKPQATSVRQTYSAQGEVPIGQSTGFLSDSKPTSSLAEQPEHHRGNLHMPVQPSAASRFREIYPAGAKAKTSSDIKAGSKPPSSIFRNLPDAKLPISIDIAKAKASSDIKATVKPDSSINIAKAKLSRNIDKAKAKSAGDTDTTSTNTSNSVSSVASNLPSSSAKRSQSSSKIQNEKRSTPKAEKLNRLAKELDKCLHDIARLKHSQKQAQTAEIFLAGNSRKKSSSDNKLSVMSSSPQNTESERTKNLKSEISTENVIEVKRTKGNKAICTNYKWMASYSRLVPQDKKISNNERTVNAEKTVGSTSTPFRNSQTKVIRTKYKMRKQHSMPTAKQVSVPQRKCSYPYAKGHLKDQTTHKCNRYKYVKPGSRCAGSQLPAQPSTSTAFQQSLPTSPASVTHRYKKVNRRAAKQRADSKQLAVIPHRSQLKLNRKRPHGGTAPGKKHSMIPHRSQLKLNRKQHPLSTPKRKSPVLRIKKRNLAKLDSHSKGSPVVRSRYKIRKVHHRTPDRLPRKPSSSSSPFKWQASKPAPAKANPLETSSFMQRRMQYILTHTPVLLRTRFRLINAPRLTPRHPSTPGGARPGSSYLHASLAPRTGRTQQQPLVRKTRMKIVRQAVGGTKRPESTFVNAKGVHYHQSKSGRSLRRVRSPILAPTTARIQTFVWSRDALSRTWSASAHKLLRHTNTRVSSTQWVASRVLRRTIQGKINRNIRSLTSQPYCKFYNRYGRCHRGDKCPYIHDPDKVAVCTQFLRGTCKKTDGTCPFSHKVSKDKMPVCVYFLKGVCNREDCPYSHVKVSKRAEVCQEFLQGYCPRGAKCKKKHTLECGEFSETGQCSLGKRCPLWHRQSRRAVSEGTRKGVKRKGSASHQRPAARPRNVGTKTIWSKQVRSSEDGWGDDPARPDNKRDALGDDGGDDDYDNDDVGDDYDDVGDDYADVGDMGAKSGSMPSFIALDTTDYEPSTPEDGTVDGGMPALKIRPLFGPSTARVSRSQQPGVASEPLVTMAVRGSEEDEEKEEEEEGEEEQEEEEEEVDRQTIS